MKTDFVSYGEDGFGLAFWEDDDVLHVLVADEGDLIKGDNGWRLAFSIEGPNDHSTFRLPLNWIVL